MKYKRFAGHILFGISIGTILSGISDEWRLFDRILFVAFAGTLFSALAEFIQAWNYTRIHKKEKLPPKDTFEWNDVAKNQSGAFLAFILCQFVAVNIWIGIGLLGCFVAYAVMQWIRNKHI